MNSKFKIKNGFYVNDIFGKIEFDSRGSENIIIYNYHLDFNDVLDRMKDVLGMKQEK